MTIIRQALGTQLREHFKSRNIPFQVVTRNGALTYEVEGEVLSPGEAADKYLDPTSKWHRFNRIPLSPAEHVNWPDPDETGQRCSCSIGHDHFDEPSAT